MGKETGEKKLPKKDEKQLNTAGYLDGYILLYRIGNKNEYPDKWDIRAISLQ